MPVLPLAEWQRAVPAGMRVLPQWVGSYRKAPLHPKTGELAKVDDPATWGTWAEVSRWYADREATIPRPYCPGFILKRGTGLVGLDFDGALDDAGKPLPWARGLLEGLKGAAYLERSPGGHGIRGFVLAALPALGARSGGRVVIGGGAVEVYDDRRHLTVTGHVWEGSGQLGLGQAALDRLLDATGLRARFQTPEAHGPLDLPTGPALAQAVAKAREALHVIPPDLSYPDWVAVLMALHSGLGAEGFELAAQWSAGKFAGQPAEKWCGVDSLKAKWASFGSRGGVGLGTLYHTAQEYGWRPGFDALPPEVDFAPFVNNGPEPKPDEKPKPSTSSDDVSDLLDTDDDASIPYHTVVLGTGKNAIEVYVKGPGNIALFLRHDPRWKGRIRYNIRRGAYLDGKPMLDPDYTRLMDETARHFGWTGPPSIEHLYRAVEQVSKENEYDPVREHLDGLKWDGTPRLDDWLVRAGAEDSEAIRLMGRRWLIGAAGRGLNEPQPGELLEHAEGTKFDVCLVLEGPQGIKKSWLFSAICPVPGYFFDSNFDFRSSATIKDLYQHLGANFIVEMAELDALNKSTEVSTVKQVLTSRHDDYRAPYARTAERHPRRSVIVGTCNELEWLRDYTGNRRWWPVPVRRMDVAWVRENRNQLWAEAVVCYRQGECYWTDDRLAVMLDGEHRDRMRLPPWSDDVGSWLETWPHRVFKIGNLVADLPMLRNVAPNIISGVLAFHGASRARLRTEGRYQAPVRWWVTPKAKGSKSTDLAADAKKVVSLGNATDIAS